MLAGEVALSTSSLKRLSEQAAKNPGDSRFLVSCSNIVARIIYLSILLFLKMLRVQIMVKYGYISNLSKFEFHLIEFLIQMHNLN